MLQPHHRGEQLLVHGRPEVVLDAHGDAGFLPQDVPVPARAARLRDGVGKLRVRLPVQVRHAEKVADGDAQARPVAGVPDPVPVRRQRAPALFQREIRPGGCDERWRLADPADPRHAFHQHRPGRAPHGLEESRRHARGHQIARRIVREEVPEVMRRAVPLLFGQQVLVGIHEANGPDNLGKARGEVGHGLTPTRRFLARGAREPFGGRTRERPGTRGAPTLDRVQETMPQWRWGMVGLPGGRYRLKKAHDHLRDLKKMPIQREETQTVLRSRRRDPQVVARHRLPLLP